MASLNKVMLIGHIGAEAVINKTKSGEKIASFSLATSESWKDKATGERKDKTEWHRVVIFNQGLCEIIEKYTNKGSKIYLEGTLRTRKWSDNNGVEKYTTEIVLTPFLGNIILLDSKESSSGNNNVEPQAQTATSSAPNNTLDDEIPF